MKIIMKIIVIIIIIIIKHQKHQESIRESYCDRGSKDLQAGICANPNTTKDCDRRDNNDNNNNNN